jgi:hypothetical protein
VPIGLEQVLPFLGYLRERHNAVLFDQAITRHDLDLEPGHDPEQSDRHPGRMEESFVLLADVHHLAMAVDDARRPQHRRKTSVVAARAFGTCGDRARHRLGVDVALVGQRDARIPERGADISDGRASKDRRTQCVAVRVENAGQSVQLEQNFCLHDRREGVTAACRSHRVPVGDRLANAGNRIVFGTGALDPLDRETLIRSPVNPGHMGSRLVRS